MNPTPDDHSSRTPGSLARNLGVPLAGLLRDARTLLRQQVELAQVETREKVSPALRSLAMIAGGGALAALGGVYLLQSVVRLIATRLPSWLASLLFGGALVSGGIALASAGARIFAGLDLVPEKTLTSLKENWVWLQHQINSRLR